MDAAIDAFRQLVEHHPDLAEARHNLAVAYARHGQSEQALQQFRDTIRLAPNFQAARLDYAALASDLGRHQEAINMLQRHVAGLWRLPGVRSGGGALSLRSRTAGCSAVG